MAVQRRQMGGTAQTDLAGVATGWKWKMSRLLAVPS